MLTLIENGEVFAPEPGGVQSVLLLDGKIGSVGMIDRSEVDRFAGAAGIDLEVVDASGRVVVPGFVDPHEHIIGGSGEKGWNSRSPEIVLREIVRWGITTVVGTLGADTTTRTMAALLTHAKALALDGITTRVWTGGYHVPPVTLLADLRADIMFVEEIIGAGEIAISDHRSVQPDPDALVRVVVDAHLGGAMSGKAGVTHFHVGEGKDRLRPIRDLLEKYTIEPGCLYLTHVERTPKLMEEAIALAKKGAWADVDVVEDSLAKVLRRWLDEGGPAERLTFSSDADATAPRILYERLCKAVVEERMPLERVLPHVTSNTARVLKLDGKGVLAPGKDADVVVLEAGTLDITHVFAKGRCMVRDGEMAVREQFLEESSRRLELHGEKA
jgi:beta-aspartyl-dipeptidase (metallo-type)